MLIINYFIKFIILLLTLKLQIMKKNIFLYILLLSLISTSIFAQRKRQPAKNTANNSSSRNVSISALKLRNVGPAFLSGRIADIAVHPENKNLWYVAVGSGGVWKTENSGTTWNPIFDNESTYSIGCVTIDPNNHSTIWVGSGENVGGRHVAYGDGVYKSENGGKDWKNMGLKSSEHISKIIVHPHNSDIVWVAAQGPLWSKGGERGLFKTIDGGKNWKKVLGVNEWTGATDLLIDPRNPNVLYAATWQRHRTVAALMGGGPGTGIHKSLDGGETWKELINGLPKNGKDLNDDGILDEEENYGHSIGMGKIGIAISPQKPDVLYAAIELERTKGAVYRSEDKGESWKKMSNTVSGATGPHYYQELYASPHKFDRLYLMNVRILTSEDGGKTFVQLKERDKHSDNHSINFRDDDPNYLLVGTDAGIYESFDLAETWKYIKNLPLTQFYKVAVNNKKPFYHIFGGTQDNGSAGGPSRTDERQGIANKHWYKILGADGHQTATDPEYNDIVYGEFQQGVLHRIDLKTGEQVLIQPHPKEGEPFERYNWDTPILVSPHSASTIFVGSQRVWKSKNRGDSWEAISSDLTRNEERIELPIMGRTQSWDNAWDIKAMSTYNTITSLSESPIKKGVIWAGTDDGIIQVTQNGGENWKKIPVSKLGLPNRTFVNDIKADLYDENTVYVALDNHKEGDFNPYLFKSSDMGETWTSISSNIPKRTLVWRIVQDHVDKSLLFAATEFGIYTSLTGGRNWQKIPGSPTISFRDLVIQKRENDLVGASFGRGFYVLDDYSPLREISPLKESGREKQRKEGSLFSIKDALWYIPKSIIGNTGGDYYFAPNPEFGAIFTYHLSKRYTTLKQERKKKEKELNKNNQNIPFPGWDALEDERREEKVKIWFYIKDEDGNVVRKITGSNKKGMNRVAWDLRHANPRPVRPSSRSSAQGGRRGWNSSGPLVTPGSYSVDLYKEDDGVISKLDGPVNFNVVPLRESTLKGTSYEDYNAFAQKVKELNEKSTIVSDVLRESMNIVNAMSISLSRSYAKSGELNKKIYDLKTYLYDLDEELNGNKSKSEIGEKNKPTVSYHMRVAMRGLSTTYGPTGLHKEQLSIAESMLSKMYEKVKEIDQVKIPEIKSELKKVGAPHILGEGIN